MVVIIVAAVTLLNKIESKLLLIGSWCTSLGICVGKWPFNLQSSFKLMLITRFEVKNLARELPKGSSRLQRFCCDQRLTQCIAINWNFFFFSMKFTWLVTGRSIIALVWTSRNKTFKISVPLAKVNALRVPMCIPLGMAMVTTRIVCLRGPDGNLLLYWLKSIRRQ